MSGFLYTVLELEEEAGGPKRSKSDAGEGTVSLLTDPELVEIAARWARQAGAHFEQAVAVGSIEAPPTLTLTGTLLGKPAQVTVRLGLGLLEDLVYVYGVFGWQGLDAAITSLARVGAKDDPVVQFVAKTHRAVTEMVLVGLDRIEQVGIVFARTRWAKAMEALRGYAGLVRDPRFPEDQDTRQFTDWWFASVAVDSCAEFVKARTAYNDIDKQMGRWPVSRGKDPSPRNPFRALWVEREAKKIATLGELTTAARRVGAHCPGLLLVLDDLNEGFGGNRNDKGVLAHRLFVEVRDLQDDTRKLLDGLRAGPLAKESLSFALTPSGQLQLLAAGGLEEYLTARLAGAEQQVLLNEGLLNDLAHPAVPDSPLKDATWERFVLGVHLRDMRASAERKAAEEAQFRRWWAALTKVVALLSLIALAATLGPAALTAGAPVALLLSATTTVTFVALTMTAIETAYSLTAQRAELSEQIRDKLHRLAVTDVAALVSIGQLISARRAIPVNVLEEVLLIALTVGASKVRKMRSVVDLYEAIQDMEVLFAPLPASASTEYGP